MPNNSLTARHLDNKPLLTANMTTFKRTDGRKKTVVNTAINHFKLNELESVYSYLVFLGLVHNFCEIAYLFQEFMGFSHLETPKLIDDKHHLFPLKNRFI